MMAKLTTIPLEPAVRDRLRGFGTAGMTYSEIVTKVLDKIELDRFVAEIQAELDDPETVWIDWNDVKDEL